MRHMLSSILATAVLAAPAFAGASHSPNDVDVDIVGAGGRQFSTYPVDSESQDVYRAYLEARNQEPYRIRVRNRSGRRIGLVIAVDGRNIISGAKSDLKRNERMYVLDPWERAQYEGWRTGSERVNEFYFTEWRDSYAEAFGDRSARGVIAVAVYRERERHYQHDLSKESESRPGAAPRARSDKGSSDSAMAREEKSRAAAQPGTGFGEEVYSPSRRVQFDPERQAASRHFIKYEWHEALCRKGVIDCDGRERNRFWDEDHERFGYAPYPPKRRR